MPLLTATGICKSFPGVKALVDVGVTVDAGEVVALVGENGAGKSTLMKIVAGVYQPDAGTLTLNGSVVHFPTPAAAITAGVSLIHQELNLAENLSVLDNLFLGREKTVGGFLGLLNRGASVAAGQLLLQRVGLPSEFLHFPVSQLAPGQKQLVEIARALGLDAKLLIMDEPTSSLTQKETDRLTEVIADLAKAGVAVLYISHRLTEIQRCCSRAVVLRDGRNVGELAKAELTHENIVRLMVGRDLQSYFPRVHRKGAGDCVLKLNNVQYANSNAPPVSFEVRAGEVLGMAGLVGAGRTELAEAVFGLRKIIAGTVTVNQKDSQISTPKDAIAQGIFLVPEDRRLHGLVLEDTVGFNLSLPNLDRLNLIRFIRRPAERSMHTRNIERLRIKTPTAQQRVGVLSGGNQQKVVFGKWLERGPKVLILDEPTRGVDVGAKAEIYALVDELAGQGVAVWMISSDMEELLGVSDRVVVMHEGRLAGELNKQQMNERNVMTLATGGELV